MNAQPTTSTPPVIVQRVEFKIDTVCEHLPKNNTGAKAFRGTVRAGEVRENASVASLRSAKRLSVTYQSNGTMTIHMLNVDLVGVPDANVRVWAS